MSVPTVEVIGIEKSFLRARALDGVTFDAQPGITGLLGPNGAGKTTLLRMIATVLAPDAGDLRMLGWDPRRAEDRLAIRRRLGYMPQEPGFHRSFTAFEFVDYVAILKEMTDRRARHDEVRRVLTLVGLEDVMDRKIKHLSGGMRRRVAIAQAFLGDPDLLVLDEPTAGVDVDAQESLARLLDGLHRELGVTILFVSHEFGAVERFVERLILVRGGIVYDGDPSGLPATWHDPSHVHP
jgi:ABC-2 type transport system ATP-binding protein